jgi:DNA polymerase alpha subunit B
MPDPCMFSVDGVVFGVTSTDVLFHLGKEELNKQQQQGRNLSNFDSHALLSLKRVYS